MAQGQQETKRYQAAFTPFTTVPVVTGVPYYLYLQHAFSDLPNNRNIAADSDQTFIGDSIYLKGIKWRVNLRWNGGGVSGPRGVPLWYRITLLSSAEQHTGEGAIPVKFYEETSRTAMECTNQRWNTQVVKVLATKKGMVKSEEQIAIKEIDLYQKFGRMIKRENNESDFSSNYFGLRGNGKQYYLALELFNPLGNVNDYGSLGVKKSNIFQRCLI